MTIASSSADEDDAAIVKKKRPFKLDLKNNEEPKKARFESETPVLLTTPDVQMLKLSSPELAKFLDKNDQSSLITPSTSSVDAEREIYAKGFAVALEKEQQQQRLKLDRKRARNRVAASRCRRKKLERISELDDKVKELKRENDELAEAASRLRADVEGLKAEVARHVRGGCPIVEVVPADSGSVSAAEPFKTNRRKRARKK